MNAGSDAAKDASAIVLLNNDFSSTVSAVREGRLIFINLRKVRHDAHPRAWIQTPSQPDSPFAHCNDARRWLT